MNFKILMATFFGWSALAFSTGDIKKNHTDRVIESLVSGADMSKFTGSRFSLYRLLGPAEEITVESLKQVLHGGAIVQTKGCVPNWSEYSIEVVSNIRPIYTVRSESFFNLIDLTSSNCVRAISMPRKVFPNPAFTRTNAN